MQEIKPCPFCGGESQVIEIQDDIWLYHVECNECCSRGSEARMQTCAIILWNVARR